MSELDDFGRGHVIITRSEWDELRRLRAQVEAVKALGNAWVGFEDSHHYGDAVLAALSSPTPDTDEAPGTTGEGGA